MATVKALPGETELARIRGTKLTSFFMSTSTRIVLTDKRVYQETTAGAQEESSIIPLSNVDSFGLAASSKTWLLIVGGLIALYGLYSLITDHSKGSFVVLLIGGILLALWWFTRKIGAVVHSLSGKTELFVLASASNMDDISTFIARIQECLESKK